jgi:hypothetical protein
MIHGLTPMPSLGPSLGATVGFDFSSDPVEEQSSLVALCAQVVAVSALVATGRVDWAAIAPLDKASRVARAKAVVFTVILRSGGGKFRTCTVENLTLRKVEFKENCTCTTFSLRYGKQALWKRASKLEGP